MSNDQRDVFATVGARVEGGWHAIDDGGRPLTIPDAAAGGLRILRTGQRVRLVRSGDAIEAVALP